MKRHGRALKAYLNERSQSDQGIYCMIQLHYVLKKAKVWRHRKDQWLSVIGRNEQENQRIFKSVKLFL